MRPEPSSGAGNMIPCAGPLADVPEPPFCVAYGIVLVALVFADNVSYVVAFCQLSIPLGAAFGILALKEPAHAPKLIGIVSMFIGLVMVATG